jgi:glycosyltransferase involved in cell wall biosynthesis
MPDSAGDRLRSRAHHASEAGAQAPLIACASTQYWDEAWFRKQHFMRRLSERYRVAYVEPSFSILRKPAPQRPQDAYNPLFGPKVRPRGERLWTVTPPRGLPFWTHPRMSPIQYRIYGAMLRRVARRLGEERVWLWVYNPLWIQAVGTLRPERVVFDLVDDLGAYEGRAHGRRTMQACVEAAIARADLVFTTSPLLAEEHRCRARAPIHVVPNGVRGEWIDRPHGEDPEDVRSLPRPRIGFVGAIFTYLDFDLLVATARAFPRASIVLVGPVQDAEGASRLAREPNVTLLGRKPQERVPDYVSAFDVCLSPFRSGAVRRAVNPLKVYEYLARGKPVVSTPLESLAGEPVARWIRMEEGADAFTSAVREALETDTPALEEERRRAVRPYAWESLAERVAEIVREAEREWRP